MNLLSNIYDLTIKPNGFIQTEILLCTQISNTFPKGQATQTHKHVHVNMCSPIKNTVIIPAF